MKNQMYRVNLDFSDLSTDITVLAVYLPEGCEPPAIPDQIQLAKQHGISGFTVVHDPSAGKQSRRTLDVLAAQGMRGFFLHGGLHL